MNEPSVWDYVKAKLTPWRGPAPSIPPAPEVERIEDSWVDPGSIEASQAEFHPVAKGVALTLPKVSDWPWRSFIALFLALMAQLSFEPRPERTFISGVVLYVLSFGWMIWACWQDEWKAAPIPASQVRQDPLTVRLSWLVGSLVAGIAAYFALGGNRFTEINVTLWVIAILLTIGTFWLGAPSLQRGLSALINYLKHPAWQIKISPWSILVLAAFVFALFFRFYHFSQTPPEMFSDHAEKLLDVGDLLSGQTKIFFERNTGREAFQFYLTALLIQLFHTGLTYTSLKLGTVLVGFATLPFIYLLGKEVANRRVGLLALIFTGMAYWPNVISRVGLRFPLYPLFAAATLYFLLRGIRRSSRNDYLLSGLFLGLGLHGYSPARILPLVVVVGVGLFLIHRISKGVRIQTILALLTLAWISLVVFLPLLRYITDPQHPEQRTLFLYRTLTRMTSIEQPLPGPPVQIFFNNLGKALVMFTWSDGEVWSESVPLRPALDVVSAALFMLGVSLLFIRYFRERHWLDLFLLVSVPLLMLPSVLSLAFPNENPLLNRTGGAIIPVFLILGIALDGLMSSITTRLTPGWNARSAGIIAAALAGLLVFLSAGQNYDLVFRQYTEQYAASDWNTSEMGALMADFAGFTGTTDTSFVIPYPYWVDTRLVGIEAGFPTKDYALAPDKLADTLSDPRMKLFMLKPEDQESLLELRSLYPNGVESTYHSKQPGKDFILYLSPPRDSTFSTK
jgi:hypothetical protein